MKTGTAYVVLKPFNSDRPHRPGDELSQEDVKNWPALRRLEDARFVCKAADYPAIVAAREGASAAFARRRATAPLKDDVDAGELAADLARRDRAAAEAGEPGRGVERLLSRGER